MQEKKELAVIKENFFTKILNKIKKIFVKKKKIEKDIESIIISDKYEDENKKQKIDFLNKIKVEETTEIIYLKHKLEKHEIRAIDLTDEQIDKLQEIYDKEILEKKNIIKAMKEESSLKS